MLGQLEIDCSSTACVGYKESKAERERVNITSKINVTKLLELNVPSRLTILHVLAIKH